MLIKKLQYASWGNYFKITASAITEVWLHWVLEFSSTESQTWWPHRPGVFSCQARITPCAAKSTKWNTSVDTKKHQITKKLLKQYSWLFRRSVCGQPVRTPASLSHSLYYFQTWAWYETRHLLTCVSGCFVIIWIDCFRIVTHIWCEDDCACVFQSSLWLHKLRVVVFGLVSAEMAEIGIYTNNLQFNKLRLRFLPIIWDYRPRTRWTSDDLPCCALWMKWAVKNGHIYQYPSKEL